MLGFFFKFKKMKFFALIFPAFILSQLHHSTISSYGNSGTNHIISIGQNSAINVNSSSNVIQGYINNPPTDRGNILPYYLGQLEYNLNIWR